jgi:hypothetical protein
MDGMVEATTRISDITMTGRTIITAAGITIPSITVRQASAVAM